MNDTISLSDLRSDYESVEVELSRIEEQARVARERRDRLADMIKNLEEWARERGGQVARPRPSAPAPPARRGKRGQNPTVREMAVIILLRVDRPMSTREVTDRLLEMGYHPRSQKRPVDAVHGSLVSVLKGKDSPLMRFGTQWGLKEWASRV